MRNYNNRNNWGCKCPLLHHTDGRHAGCRPPTRMVRTKGSSSSSAFNVNSVRHAESGFLRTLLRSESGRGVSLTKTILLQWPLWKGVKWGKEDDFRPSVQKSGGSYKENIVQSVINPFRLIVVAVSMASDSTREVEPILNLFSSLRNKTSQCRALSFLRPIQLKQMADD